VRAGGRATLRWDSAAGADLYVVERDGREVAEVRAEGSEKRWADPGAR
jgi:hypothetical protein